MPEIILDLEELTLNPEEARSSSEMIIREFEQLPEIRDLHDIQTGIERETFIPIVGEISEELGQCLEGLGCNVPEEEASIVFSQKKWHPKSIGTRLKHCMKTTNPLFKVFKKKLNHLESWDGTGSEEVAFIEERVLQALKKMVLRYSQWGDTDITVDDLTAGLDVSKFNCIDGVWKQIFQGVTAGKITRVEIAENAGATYNAQNTLDEQRAWKVMRDLYNKSNPAILEMPGVAFFMTRSMFNNWVDFRESKGFDVCCEGPEKALSSVRQYRGIPIKVINYWDTSIKKFFNNGTKLNLPNRVILSATSNMPIGTEDENSLSNLDSFYWKKDKANYVDIAFSLDTNVLLEDLISVAY